MCCLRTARPAAGGRRAPAMRVRPDARERRGRAVVLRDGDRELKVEHRMPPAARDHHRLARHLQRAAARSGSRALSACLSARHLAHHPVRPAPRVTRPSRPSQCIVRATPSAAVRARTGTRRPGAPEATRKRPKSARSTLPARRRPARLDDVNGRGAGPAGRARARVHAREPARRLALQPWLARGHQRARGACPTSGTAMLDEVTRGLQTLAQTPPTRCAAQGPARQTSRPSHDTEHARKRSQLEQAWPACEAVQGGARGARAWREQRPALAARQQRVPGAGRERVDVQAGPAARRAQHQPPGGAGLRGRGRGHWALQQCCAARGAVRVGRRPGEPRLPAGRLRGPALRGAPGSGQAAWG